MIDYAIQRTNMVDSQVRTSDVTDRRILRAMGEVPRELFVPGAAKALAYIDENLLVAQGEARRFLLAPRTFAKLVQVLDVGPDHAVLDIGCATGYSTAILARLARRVIGLEQDPDLERSAKATITSLGVENAVIEKGPLSAGVAQEGPYDAVLINGSIGDLPHGLLDQLKDGGRLAAIVADGTNLGKATLWRRSGPTFDGRPVFDAAAPTLPGFERAKGFVF